MEREGEGAKGPQKIGLMSDKAQMGEYGWLP